MSNDNIKRVRTVRTITYQGPADWVDNCIEKILKGTTEFGTGKFVISVAHEIDNEVPVNGIVADNTVDVRHKQIGDEEPAR